jgi:hypothetical protein
LWRTSVAALLRNDGSPTLPSEFGSIQEFHQGTETKTVILIQDAHAIPDAQKSIRGLIDYFQKEYGVGLVAVEGASSQLDSQIFRSFPDKDLLKKVFEEYESQGELAGGTSAAIFSDSSSLYHGIEDWNLYEEGIALYLKAIEQAPEILKEAEGRR